MKRQKRYDIAKKKAKKAYRNKIYPEALDTVINFLDDEVIPCMDKELNCVFENAEETGYIKIPTALVFLQLVSKDELWNFNFGNNSKKEYDVTATAFSKKRVLKLFKTAAHKKGIKIISSKKRDDKIVIEIQFNLK